MIAHPFAFQFGTCSPFLKAIAMQLKSGAVALLFYSIAYNITAIVPCNVCIEKRPETGLSNPYNCARIFIRYSFGSITFSNSNNEIGYP